MDERIERLSEGVPALLRWYDAHRRPLPFRDDPTPYRVWVSEIMLQQTRIEAVLPHYEEFMRELPTVEALATVDEQRLLKLWEGLGYYSRARNLQKAARQIMERYGGELPADYEALRSLCGIGEYTAGAIASIAYGIAVPAVDGNVLRVLARLLCYEQDVLKSAPRAYLTKVARALLPSDRAGAFNEALMELGETICLPNTAPHCDECPLREFCEARKAGRAAELPTRLPKTQRRIERRTTWVVLTEETPARVLLHRRDDSGLLAGLWELPNAEESADATEILTRCGLTATSPMKTLAAARHLFSHIEWKMTGIEVTVLPSPSLPQGYVWADATALEGQYALPSAFRAYAKQLPARLREKRRKEDV